MPFPLIVGGLIDPNVEKLNLTIQKPPVEILITDESENDLKSTFFLYKNNPIFMNGIIEEISKFVDRNSFTELFISHIVFNQGKNILDNISTIYFSRLNQDSIYTTNYGTLIIEWNNMTDVFSLEIGKSSIGYFYEKNNEIFTVTELSLANDFLEETMNKLNKDLSNFHL